MHKSLSTYVAIASTLSHRGSLGAQSSADARLARTKAAADRIRAEDILRDVSYLASDANMGRRTPPPVSRHPAMTRPPHTSRDFSATCTSSRWAITARTFSTTRSRARRSTRRKVGGAIGNEPITWGEDFLVQSFLVPGVREANVIYVGTGIRRPKMNVDPYAGVDIKGKWLW
jgi:hypothetical protein